MEAAVGPQSDRGYLQGEFAEVALPIVAIELSGLHIVAATPSALAETRLSVGEVIGRSVLDVVAPSDRRRAELAFEALAAGGIDFVRAHGRLVGQDEVFTHWVAALDMDGRRLAATQIAAGMSNDVSPLNRYLGSAPLDLAVGTVTDDWVVSAVSSGVEQLVGIPAARFVGRLLLGTVSRSDVDRVLRAALETKSDLSVGLAVEMRTADGGWRRLRVVLGALASSTRRFFILAPDTGPGDMRALKLEEHLRRIAAEVQASGIIEVAPEMPALTHVAGRARFTPRQWDVLTRLIRGERTATIADELFVSESTVRNHLSAIYERLGIHSQAELMALAVGHRGPI